MLKANALALDTFATAFASAVIIETDKTSWLARKGQFCVFEVLRRVSPQVRDNTYVNLGIY